MLPIHKILCPTDFSDSAHAAFELAYALARDYRASLVVVHVAPPTAFAVDGIMIPAPTDDQLELQARLVQLYPVGSDIEADYRVLDGDAGERIVRAASDTKADVIVMGTHGKSGISRLLTGSVADTVMRRAPCPVLTVRGPFHLPLAHASVAETEDRKLGTE